MENLSQYISHLQVKEKKIFDPIRKKWVALTPEEFVRQSVIYELIHIKNISPSKILSEYNYTWNQRKHRCDIIILDTAYQPQLIIEVKAAHIALGEKAYQQASRYLYISAATGLLITNGVTSIHLHKTDQDWQVVDNIFEKLGIPTPSIQP